MPKHDAVPPFEAREGKDTVFVQPSASGPTQKITREGVVMPGKAHEAKTGKVSNPGVRTAGAALTAPRCPQCGQPTLKMRMNAPAGKRMYCSNKKDCGYDQADQSKRSEKIKTNPDVRIISGRRSATTDQEHGVKILRSHGAQQ